MRVMKKLGKINMMIYCDLGWSDKPLLLITNQHLHTRRHQDSHTHVDGVQDDDDGDDADDDDDDDGDDDDDDMNGRAVNGGLEVEVKPYSNFISRMSCLPQD